MIRFLVKSLDEEILQISGSLNPPHIGSLFMIFCSSQSLAARNGTSYFWNALKENKFLGLIMSRLVNLALDKILNFLDYVKMAVVNKNHDFRKMNPLEKRLSKEQRYREAYKGIVLHSLIEYEVQKLEDHSHILQQLGTWRSVWIKRLVLSLSLQIFSSMDTSVPPLNYQEARAL